MSGGRSRRREWGFSLVELVVALTVLAISALGLAATARVVADSMMVSYLDTRIAIAAQSALERLLARENDDLASGTSADGPVLVSWTLGDGELRELSLVVSGRLAGIEVRDTVVAFVR
jgi:prepilin-type N-terminal cleavage/methylation domain-containing protein